MPPPQSDLDAMHAEVPHNHFNEVTPLLLHNKEHDALDIHRFAHVVLQR